MTILGYIDSGLGVRSEMSTEELTLTKGDMNITGSVSAIANLLVSIDNIYEDHERELQIDKKRESEILSTPFLPRVSYQSLYKEKRAELDKRRVQYPKPRVIADAYIKQFGKKYDRYIAIDFIKGYLSGRRLTNKYRRRVLMSIIDIVNNTGKTLIAYKKNENKNKSKPKRHWIKRDWDALARQYVILEPRPTINKFFEDNGISMGNYSYLRNAIKKIQDTINGTKPPVFSTSTSSSVG